MSTIHCYSDKTVVLRVSVIIQRWNENKKLFLLILTAHCTMQLKEISIAYQNRLNPNHIHVHVAVRYTFTCTGICTV